MAVQWHDQRGAAAVEYVALSGLVAALIAVLAGGILATDGSESRLLGSRIAMKLRCAARLPGPCWQDPLTEIYGRQVAGLVRAWAPQPGAIGGLVPVDPRRCRSASCARPADQRLTTSNRRITVFSLIVDRRRRNGTLRIEYWSYRPGLGWSVDPRIATRADLTANAATPLLESAVPQVLPLEPIWSLRAEITSARGDAP